MWNILTTTLNQQRKFQDKYTKINEKVISYNLKIIDNTHFIIPC